MRSSVWKTTGEAIDASPHRLLVRSKWEVLFRPMSAKNGKTYHGGNAALLSWYLSVHPDKIPIFVTFEAAKKLIFAKPKTIPASLAEFRKCITFAKTSIRGQSVKKGSKAAPIIVPLPSKEDRIDPLDPHTSPWMFKAVHMFSVCDITGADDTIGTMMETLNAMQRLHLEDTNIEQLTTEWYLLSVLQNARFSADTEGKWVNDTPMHADKTSIVNNTTSVNLSCVNPNGRLTANELGTIVAYLFDFVAEQLEVFFGREDSDDTRKKRRKLDASKSKATSVVLACEFIIGTLAAACGEDLTDTHCLHGPFVNVATHWCPGYNWGTAIKFGLSESEMKKAVTDAVTVGNLVLDGSISGVVRKRCAVIASLQTNYPRLFGPLGEYAFNIDVLQRILRFALPIPRPSHRSGVIRDNATENNQPESANSDE
jgi:hypothetical protein